MMRRLLRFGQQPDDGNEAGDDRQQDDHEDHHSAVILAGGAGAYDVGGAIQHDAESEYLDRLQR